MELRPYIEATEAQAQIAAMVDAGQYEQALWTVASTVQSFYTSKEVIGHALYLRGLDQQLERIAAALHDPELAARTEPGSGFVVIMSEFYNSGGHSRVTEDLVQELGGAVVVMTDVFSSYANGRLTVDQASERMPKAMVYPLPAAGFLPKVQQLQSLLRAVRPQAVLVMTHHQDPIPYVALASLPPTVRKVFFHHCDHQPALGNTMPGYRHVDFTEHLQHICAQNLQRPTDHMPLFVADQGLKPFSMPAGLAGMSVVGSGSSNKFQREGSVALSQVVCEVLSCIGGIYWHIGQLPDDWQAEIRAELAVRGIAQERFQYVAHVPSLWQALQSLDAHAYLGSFPVPGGRGAIEAQGCGYPAVYYAHDDRAPLLRHADIFGSKELGWTTLSELRNVLDHVAQNQAHYVAAARDYYLQQYSHGVFSARLRQVLQGD